MTAATVCGGRTMKKTKLVDGGDCPGRRDIIGEQLRPTPVCHVIARTLDWHGPFPSAPAVPPVSDQIAAPVYQRPPSRPLCGITFDMDINVQVCNPASIYEYVRDPVGPRHVLCAAVVAGLTFQVT
jgi:hypothetical protein